jgi:uncharacterized protein YifE (UPF0438 family)
MSIPEDHRELLARKDYALKCSRKIFTADEYEILREFGYWLEGLASGAIQPFTPEQRQFVIVAQGKTEPVGPYYEWKEPGEVWFSRKDIERMSPYYPR